MMPLALLGSRLADLSEHSSLLSTSVGLRRSACRLTPTACRGNHVITRTQQHLDESVRGCLFSLPGVFGFGLLINGNLGFGVLPESQEIFIPLAGGGFVAHHFLRPGQLQMC